MTEQCCSHSKQCRNNVATLCCAKNRRCESCRVTSPSDPTILRATSLLAFGYLVLPSLNKVDDATRTVTRRSKKQQVLIAKQQLCTCTTLFCTFLCPCFCTTATWTCLLNFAFYRRRKQATTNDYFSLCTWIRCLGVQLQEGSPTFDKVSG